MARKDKSYGIESVIDFGKYSGYTMGTILELDPEWIVSVSKLEDGKLIQSKIIEQARRNLVQTNDQMDDY
jgi:hypothetical protein